MLAHPKGKERLTIILQFRLGRDHHVILSSEADVWLFYHQTDSFVSAYHILWTRTYYIEVAILCVYCISIYLATDWVIEFGVLISSKLLCRVVTGVSCLFLLICYASFSNFYVCYTLRLHNFFTVIPGQLNVAAVKTFHTMVLFFLSVVRGGGGRLCVCGGGGLRICDFNFHNSHSGFLCRCFLIPFCLL